MHHRVCAGTLTLAQAQKEIAFDRLNEVASKFIQANAYQPPVPGIGFGLNSETLKFTSLDARREKPNPSTLLHAPPHRPP